MSSVLLLKLFLFVEAGFTAFLVMVLIAIRPYFRSQAFFWRWMWAWTAHAANLSVALWLTRVDWGTPFLRSFTLLVSVILGMLFIPLLIAGAEAFRNSGQDARVVRAGTIAAIATALGIYVLSMLAGSGSALGFEIRTIPREIAASGALWYCAYFFFRHWKRTASSGSLLALLSCGGYGVARTLYALFTMHGHALNVGWVAIDTLCQGGIAIATLLLILEHEATAESEVRRLQEHLFQAQKMEAIGSFAGGVAHDFNNLLMVITAYCELLADGLSDAEQRAQAAEALKACWKGADLTRQLLMFSRKQPIAPQVLDLSAIVRDMSGMLRRLLDENIELHFELQENLSRCRADATHVQQIVMNLAANARDAMPRGGRLLIQTSDATLDPEQAAAKPASIAPGDYVVLTFSDSGSGIDPAIQGRIFEPFFTTKELGKGTGLGLSTVYGIVKQNNGFIFVESELGQGATFRIYLPRVRDAVAAASPALKEIRPEGRAPASANHLARGR